jgi:hypothetical protein
MHIMDANEQYLVGCRDGLFFIPEALLSSLSSLVPDGFVYLRQDSDTMMISSTRIAGGQRRVLSGRFRANMFRQATELAIVDLRGVIQVMAVV